MKGKPLSLADMKRERIGRIGPYLSRLSETQIDRLVETGDVLRDNAFWPETQGEFGQFYAPFDWINESADIVLIGITPGKRQAKSSFKALRAALSAGKSAEEAARMAKQAASFDRRAVDEPVRFAQAVSLGGRGGALRYREPQGSLHFLAAVPRAPLADQAKEGQDQDDRVVRLQRWRQRLHDGYAASLDRRGFRAGDHNLQGCLACALWTGASVGT